MSNFTIKKAELKEMDFFLALAKEEGWNPGLHDAAAFYQADPNGFFIGQINGDNVGCISAVAYGESFGFIGLYIIAARYRHQGFGIQLWNHAIRYLGERCMGLDGVLAQQESYKKSKFQLHYRNIRFEGKRPPLAATSLMDLHQIPFESVLQYDLPIFGVPRRAFLERWFQMPQSYCLGKVDQGRLRGYGVMRSCIKGYKIGPLFADDFEVAQEIYQGLCAHANDEPIYLDVPEINPWALQLAEKAQLQRVFETARMYNQAPPPQQLNKVFGITTFELG